MWLCGGLIVVVISVGVVVAEVASVVVVAVAVAVVAVVSLVEATLFSDDVVSEEKYCSALSYRSQWSAKLQ